MGFLDFLKKKPVVEEHRAREVQFLAEQDGASEQDLKRVLTKLLEVDRDIERAYLVRVQYGSKRDVHVALCLDARVAKQVSVMALSSEFAKMFNNTQHLDVLYLNPVQRNAVAGVASPFYSRPNER
jgi:hypothetical protein